MTHKEGQDPVSKSAALPPTERLEGLDSLRAYAATAIIVFHMIHVAHVELPPGLTFARNYFGLGVPLFFVVSAFSLTFGYIERFRSLADIGMPPRSN